MLEDVALLGLCGIDKAWIGDRLARGLLEQLATDLLIGALLFDGKWHLSVAHGDILGRRRDGGTSMGERSQNRAGRAATTTRQQHIGSSVHVDHVPSEHILRKWHVRP